MSKITFPGGGGGGGAGVSDHGGLAGLADDDHSQYLLVDATRAALALVSSGGVVLDENALLYLGTSGSISHVALKRDGAQLRVRLGDDSDDANLFCQTLVTNNDVRIPAAKAFEFFGRAHLLSPADGEVTIKNAAETASGIIRAASGIFSKNILPDTSGGGQLGSRSFPWGSGVFDDGFWIRGDTDITSPGFDRNGGNIRTVAMNGGLTNIESNSLILNTVGSILWGSTQGGFTSPADGEVLVSNAAGGSGLLIAASGKFNNVTLIAPDNSLWDLTVDVSGVLTTTSV